MTVVTRLNRFNFEFNRSLVAEVWFSDPPLSTLSFHNRQDTMASASVPHRVHIAPQGYEDERIFLSALDLEAEKVILLPHDDEDDTGSTCRETIIEELEAEDVDVEVESCNLFDMGDALEVLLEKIRGESGNDVKVNVSAGSKITAIAGMLACMFTGADPIYAYPEGYSRSDDGDQRITVSYGLKKTVRLPAYPIAEPDYQLIAVLEFIEDEQPDEGPEGVLLRDIGEFLLESDLPAVRGSDKQPGEAEDIYPTVHKVTNPLIERELVNKTRFKNGDHVRTTSKGKELVDIGKGLIAGIRS